MTTAFRIDAQRLDERPMRRDQRGMLIVPAYTTRTGVFTYLGDDGKTVRELRHPDDVFSKEHLDSLANASVTVGHPKEHVTAANSSVLEAGVVLNPRREGNFVAAELSIRRADTIRRVEARELVELSCGYTLRVDSTPGVYEGQPYEQRQRDLRVNHVGLGPKGWGRAGPEVRIRADSGGELIVRPLVSFTENIRADQGGDMEDEEELEEWEQEMYDRFDAAVERARAAGNPVAMARLEERQREREREDADDDSTAGRLNAAVRRHRGIR